MRVACLLLCNAALHVHSKAHKKLQRNKHTLHTHRSSVHAPAAGWVGSRAFAARGPHTRSAQVRSRPQQKAERASLEF